MKILRLLSFLSFIFLFNLGNTKDIMSIYDFSIKDIEGKIVNLSKFKGQPIFIVNTASKCGFTPQYENLQNLFLKYKNSKLTILAITSNSFNQEYSSSEEIKKICLVNYNIGFITSSPVDVKGENAHEIFKWLKTIHNKTPKWNFYKFLFDKEGQLKASWSSLIKPDSFKITKQINSLL